MNAVACEVQVIATGARAAEPGGTRELFTEETTTALVFENGGVLRLAAAVAPGQLLFLTHKESKREVVAQVTRKRDFLPPICYVEVEFSESSPGFWGVKFPDAPAAVRVTTVAPAMTASPAVVPAPQESAGTLEPVELPELVEQAGPMEEDFIGDVPALPTVAPSAQDVAALKTEVEALREQLKLLQTAAGAVSSEASRVPVDPAAQGSDPVTTPAPPLPKLRLRTGEDAHGPATEISRAAGGEGAVAPRARAEAANERNEASFSEEDLLPKPALNFDTGKPPRKASSKPKAEHGQSVAANGLSSAVRKDLLFAAFVLVTVGALWFENMVPGLPRPKFFGPNAAPLVAAHPAARAAEKTPTVQTDAPRIAKASEAATAASASTTAQNEAARTGGGARHDTTQPAVLETAKAPAPTAAGAPSADKVKTVPEATADAAAPENSTEKSEIVAPAKNRAATPALSKAAMVSAEEPTDDAGIVPPKLIKAVRAVASPNALQEFSSGGAESVTFDAVVDTSGRVKPVKVLSGATDLRVAATEALKQYQYEPATRRGKPVAARVTVTVKFLFER